MDSTCVNISRLIPHRGAMCLLDSVENWDAGHIVCKTTTHRLLDNPLRDDSGLRAICGIEYGAQAIAAHAALLGGEQGRGPVPLSGLLASARDVTATLSHLDNLTGPLLIRATLVLTHDQGSMYDIVVKGEGRTVLTGRLSVMKSIDNPHDTPPAATEGAA